MITTLQIVKRNMINYFYDKTTMFFSFLSVFILILIYVLFLGQMQINEIERHIGDVSGISGVVTSWLVAGLVITSSVTVPLATMSDMIADIENKTFNDFYVAPIKRFQIVLAYVISSIIIGVMMAVVTLLLGFFYLGITSGTWLSLMSLVYMILIIIVSSTLFSSLSYVLLSFVKTASAAGTLNTLVGTLIGFFAGIYVPFGAFSERFQNILKLNPAAQVVSLARKVMTEPYTAEVFQGAPENFVIAYKENYGITFSLFGQTINDIWIFLFMFAWITIMLLIGLARIKAFKMYK